MELRKAVDNLCIYDPEFSQYAVNFQAEVGGSCATQSVSSLDELRAAVDKFVMVKYLEVLLHGGPGMIYFANGGAMVGSYLGTLTQKTNFIQKEARILFLSCDIGKGDQGDVFMSKLAQEMLVGKGGIIGASTVTNVIFHSSGMYSSGVYLEELSGGQLKVRRYDASGAQIGARAVNRYGTVQ